MKSEKPSIEYLKDAVRTLERRVKERDEKIKELQARGENHALDAGMNHEDEIAKKLEVRIRQEFAGHVSHDFWKKWDRIKPVVVKAWLDEKAELIKAVSELPQTRVIVAPAKMFDTTTIEKVLELLKKKEGMA